MQRQALAGTEPGNLLLYLGFPAMEVVPPGVVIAYRLEGKLVGAAILCGLAERVRLVEHGILEFDEAAVLAEHRLSVESRNGRCSEHFFDRPDRWVCAAAKIGHIRRDGAAQPNRRSGPEPSARAKRVFAHPECRSIFENALRPYAEIVEPRHMTHQPEYGDLRAIRE